MAEEEREERKMILEAIIFSAFLELGYLPADMSSMLYESDYFNEFVIEDVILYSDLEFRASWYGVYLGGGVRTYFCKNREAVYFFPFRNDYRIFAGFKIKFFEIGVVHQCCHPVIPHYYYLTPSNVQDSVFNKIFVRFSMGGKK